MTKLETIEKSIKYRGTFLHHVSILEAYLNLYIANYFIGQQNPNKMAELQEVILGDERFSFNSTVQVFKHLAQKYDEEWYNSCKSLRPHDLKNKPHLLNADLIHIVENRNIFAHRILENYERDIFEKSKPDGAIRFVRLKDEAIPVDFTDDSFSLLIRLISFISMFIIERCKKR